MAEPYTANDVEALAKHMATAVGSRVFQPLHDEEIDRTIRDEFRVQAGAALTWLTDRLLPAEGETRTQWGWRIPGAAGIECYDEHHARSSADEPGDEVIRRTVTTWPDGTTLTGPWTPASDWVGRNCDGCGQRVAARSVTAPVLCHACHPGDLPLLPTERGARVDKIPDGTLRP